MKLLAGIGGIKVGSAVFSKVAGTQSLRSRFIGSVSSFLDPLSQNFDGVNIDWEFPAQNAGSSDNDKENFVTLLRELSNVLNMKGKSLSVAVAAVESSAKISYPDIPSVAQYVEFVSLMSYNLLDSTNSHTGKKPIRRSLISN